MNLNIRKWVDHRFPDNLITPTGQNIRVNCPFCSKRDKSSDTKHHLYISLTKPVAHCFRCEWSGSYVWLIKEIDNCTFARAYQQLEAVTPSIESASKLLQSLTQPRDKNLPDITEGVPVGFRPLVPGQYLNDSLSYMAVTYLASRGIEVTDIFSGKWGVVDNKPYVFTTIENKFWQGRRLIPGDPKYLNPNLPKTHGVLYNGHHLVNPDHPKIYITEGYFSAYTLEKRDKVLAVALLAKTAVEGQLRRLAAYPGKLVVMLDSDALASAITLARQLVEYGHEHTIIADLKEGDPDTCGDWMEFPFSFSTTVLLKFGLPLDSIHN